MNLKTFSAPNFAAAMALVKTEMGTDAVILHTRTLHRRYCLGLRKATVVEITAGSGLNVASRGIRRDRGPGGASQHTKPKPTQPQAAQPQQQQRPAPLASPGKDLLET